jgi:hypothetical protein
VCDVLQVLAYLHAFADAYGLHEHIQLNTAVTRIDPVTSKSSAATMTAAAAEGAVRAGVQTTEPRCSAGWAEATAVPCAACRGSCSSSSPCCMHQSQQAGAGVVFPLQSDHELQWRVVTQHSSSSSQHSWDTPSAASQAAAATQAGASTADGTPQGQQQQQQEWLFDAVAVCVGIFSEPNLPKVRDTNSRSLLPSSTAVG